MYLIVGLGYAETMRDTPSFREPRHWVPVTVLIVAQAALYWFAPRLLSTRLLKRVHIPVQGVLTFVIVLLMPDLRILLPLYIGLFSTTASYLQHDRPAAIWGIVCCAGLACLNLLLIGRAERFFEFLSESTIWFAFAVTYTALFTQEVRARKKTQKLLDRLGTTHRQLQSYAEQVEALTVSQERQRMAQELHDTLVQGVAGLILQLEAIDGHMESSSHDRAHEGLRQAMQRARHTLHEARRAIQALRSAELEPNDLVAALRHEAERLEATTGLQTAFKADAQALDASPQTAQDILRIVQESLSNVRRHAQADHVSVRLIDSGTGIRVIVQDDGVGFAPNKELRRPDCFGLIGMQERAQRIGGTLQIKSVPGEGTTVMLDLGDASV
jgi:NarL family two-component system sensor histidine kinase YdfH